MFRAGRNEVRITIHGLSAALISTVLEINVAFLGSVTARHIRGDIS